MTDVIPTPMFLFVNLASGVRAMGIPHCLLSDFVFSRRIGLGRREACDEVFAVAHVLFLVLCFPIPRQTENLISWAFCSHVQQDLNNTAFT